MLPPLLAVVAVLLWAPAAGAVTIQVDITPDNSNDDALLQPPRGDRGNEYERRREPGRRHRL